MALEITDDTFSDIRVNNKIVIVDFWAQWCGPCRMLGPIIDELSTQYKGDSDVVVGKLNVDKNPSTTATNGIRGIPAVLFYKDGQLVDKMVGVASKNEYINKIEGLKA